MGVKNRTKMNIKYEVIGCRKLNKNEYKIGVKDGKLTQQ